MLTAFVMAADWPQFLGLHRDGKADGGSQLISSFPAEGPKIVWQQNCGSGFAGPVVQGTKLSLFHRVGDESVVEAMETGTGKKLWRAAWPTDFDSHFRCRGTKDG